MALEGLPLRGDLLLLLFNPSNLARSVQVRERIRVRRESTS